MTIRMVGARSVRPLRIGGPATAVIAVVGGKTVASTWWGPFSERNLTAALRRRGYRGRVVPANREKSKYVYVTNRGR
jgi:hypothetical protein